MQFLGFLPKAFFVKLEVAPQSRSRRDRLSVFLGHQTWLAQDLKTQIFKSKADK